jgi:hypothetical protein
VWNLVHSMEILKLLAILIGRLENASFVSRGNHVLVVEIVDIPEVDFIIQYSLICLDWIQISAHDFLSQLIGHLLYAASENKAFPWKEKIE